jgi:hypothetical protein
MSGAVELERVKAGRRERLAPRGGHARGVKKTKPDHPCVLPAGRFWIQEAAYLQKVFATLAVATDRAGDAEPLLETSLTYSIAADVLERIDLEVPADDDVPEPYVHLMALPAFELDALWSTLNAVRQADAAEREAAHVRRILQDYGSHGLYPAKTLSDMAADLERVLAVLSLDTPESRTVAAALALGQEPDATVFEAYKSLESSWKAVGAIRA